MTVSHRLAPDTIEIDVLTHMGGILAPWLIDARPGDQLLGVHTVPYANGRAVTTSPNTSASLTPAHSPQRPRSSGRPGTAPSPCLAFHAGI